MKSTASRLVIPLAAFGLAVLPAPAQQDATPTSPVVLAGSCRVPIHTQPADPEGGAYGIWASGESYKASFHDGFAYYPYLGPAVPENLPLAWRTQAVTVGGEALMAAAPAEVRASDWRFEYRHGSFVEAYDLYAEGVEQTFTLLEPPARAGDLVIEGAIETRLRSDVVDEHHGSLVFRDAAGRPVVEYGAAWVLDAAGRQRDVATRFDGKRLELRVDRAWLDDARYPVVVDPLFSTRWIIDGHLSQAGTLPDIAHDAESADVMITWSRYSSATDLDGYGMLRDDSLGTNIALVYTDVTATWSTSYVRAAFVGGADKWVLAVQKYFPITGWTRVRAYVHDKNNRVLNSGSQIFLTGTPSTSQEHPDIGGVQSFATGRRALIAYQETNNIFAVIVDAPTPAFGFPVQLDETGVFNAATWPAVNQVAGPSADPWLVTWQEANFAFPGDDLDLRIAQVDVNGALVGRAYCGPSGTSSLHALRPVVEGMAGRYLASYVVRSNTGSTTSGWGFEVRAQRINWSAGASGPSWRGPERVIASDTLNSFYNGSNIGYDRLTRSHWAVAYHSAPRDTYIVRLGRTGAPVEAATIERTSTPTELPAVCFRSGGPDFAVVWVATDPALPRYRIEGTRLLYDPDARNVLYGTGCQGSVSAHMPYAGSEFYRVELQSGVPQAPTALFLGTGTASFTLPGGCLLNVAPPLFTLWAGNANVFGGASVQLALPDKPLAIGDLYMQYLQIDAAVLVGTRGIKSQVR